jgi:hypothetical protein
MFIDAHKYLCIWKEHVDEREIHIKFSVLVICTFLCNLQALLAVNIIFVVKILRVNKLKCIKEYSFQRQTTK